ncbi:putative aldouronate transport system permease protein, partial [Paenibacillus barengoltzii J12]
MLNKLWRQRAFHLMLIPGVVLVFIFSYLPFYGLIISFQDYNPGLGFNSPWVGMENFHHVFQQPNFIRTIWNTLYMSIFKIIGGIVVPVIFALLLNEVAHTFIKRTFQTLVYLPNFLSWVIMAG